MLDMALFQWALIGSAVLEPRTGGLQGLSRKDMEDIFHTLRMFSFVIGIGDQFNIFADERYESVYALCKLIQEHEYIPRLVSGT